MDVVQDKGNDHKLIITLSNLFTTPLATGVPFSYEDMTPVAMLALDNFVLWVNADTEYQTAADYIEAVAAAGRRQVPDGRHRVQAGGPDHHRGDRAGHRAPSSPTCRSTVAATSPCAVVGGHVNSSVNNPIEQVSHWQGGATRPLCVFAAERLEVEGDVPWGDIPTCKEAGIRDAVPDAARHLHAGRASTRRWSTTTSISSRRCARPRSGRSSWQNGAFTQTSMTRRRIRRLGGRGGRAAQDPDDRGRLPRDQLTAGRSGARDRGLRSVVVSASCRRAREVSA